MRIKFVRHSRTARVEPPDVLRHAKCVGDQASPLPPARTLQECAAASAPSLTALPDNVNGDSPVIEDFRPLYESLEWTLGQQYWQSTGCSAFLADDVPFRITNDGNLSRKAAEVFFASICAAERHGPLEDRFQVLELGAGVGLFARFFLDTFQELCRRNGKNYYDRMRYVLADCSPRMLEDLKRHNLLADHALRCEFRLADALRPGFGFAATHATGRNGQAAPFRAVILNYLLDCLPATILRFKHGRITQLEVRTRLARGLDHRPAGMSLDHIRRCARSSNPAERARLAALVRWFALDLDYRAVNPGEIPFSSTAARHAAGQECVVLHNFGAIQCLEHALPLLSPGGFVLLNDYDDSPFDPVTQSFRHQRFGGSAAFGLNASLLERHFTARPDCEWITPPGDNRHLCSRLLGCELPVETIESFREQFSRAAYDWHFIPIEQARHFLQAGRHESARGAFAEALKRQPSNWALMTELADLLTFTLRDHAAALLLTESALKLNPLWPPLWNTHGDCLYYLGRVTDAQNAFLRALELNPNDVRSRYNLSFTYRDGGEPAAALHAIAAGLARDNGDYTERLLKQQQEILSQLKAHEAELRRCLTDRCRMSTDPQTASPAAGLAAARMETTRAMPERCDLPAVLATQ